MKVGIVGLPNVGKSTLFNCLSQSKAQSENYPFCTIDPNVSIVNVPDLRLDKLSSLINPQKLIPTTVKIVDIAGLVKGASKGEGLGNKFLSHIRETQCVAHVVRCFEDQNVIHVDGKISPINDLETIETELMLSDLEIVENRIEKLEKQLRNGDKALKKEFDCLSEIKNEISSNGFRANLQIEKCSKQERLKQPDYLYIGCLINGTPNGFGKKMLTERRGSMPWVPRASLGPLGGP